MAKKGEKSAYVIEKMRPKLCAGMLFTVERKLKFLRELRETGNVTKSSTRAGIVKRTAYNHKASDPEFAARWEEAKDTYLDNLEQSLGDRGKGFYEPNGGKYVYSDTAALGYLNANRPEKYNRGRENRLAITRDETITIQISDDLKTVLEMAALNAKLAKNETITIVPKNLEILDQSPPDV